MAPSLPRFIVLKSSVNGKYLSCIRNHEETPGFLQFSGEEIVSPHCKFEVEDVKDEENEGLVHIRCCFNNRYWASPKNTHWITAQAHKKEENQSEWACTLFKPTLSSKAHVQFCNISHGQNASWWNAESPNNNGLYSGKSATHNADILTFIDWETLMILPKYVTFKDSDGSFLGARDVDGRKYLKFQGSGDIEDPTIGHEVFHTPDGNIRIKSNYTGKFWRRSPNWIWPDSEDSSNADLDTLFSVTKIDDNTIALRNLGNNEYCKTLSTEGKEYCLNASADTIWKDVHLQVGEYVIKRDISHVVFHLHDARIYDEEIIHDTNQITTNEGSSPVNKTLKFTYKTEKSQTWSDSVSLKLGIKTSIKAGIPSIAEGEVSVSAEVESKFEWGETKSESFDTESTHTVEVPAKSKVIVKLQAKKASCDIPYSYRQCDTLFNETKVTYDKDDGIYKGINTFNFECQISKELPLTNAVESAGGKNAGTFNRILKDEFSIEKDGMSLDEELSYPGSYGPEKGENSYSYDI